VDDLVKRTMPPCSRPLTDAGLKPGDINEVILVGGQTRMPKVQEIVKSFFGKEPHKGVNPRGVGHRCGDSGWCARGRGQGRIAARRHAAVARHRDAGRRHHRPDSRNTTIPTKKSEVFSTAEDNQTTVEIHVLQGERQMAADNRTIGKFQLTGIPPAPRGIPQVEVTFDIDAKASCTFPRRTRRRARSRRSGSKRRPAWRTRTSTRW